MVADPISRKPDLLALTFTRAHFCATRAQIKQLTETCSVPPDTNEFPEVGTDSQPACDPMEVDTPEQDEPRLDDRPWRDKIIAGYSIDPWFAAPENTPALNNEHGIWLRDGKTAVPDTDDLRRQLLYELHDSPYSGHI
jgi:hypothetical protein